MSVDSVLAGPIQKHWIHRSRAGNIASDVALELEFSLFLYKYGEPRMTVNDLLRKYVFVIFC